MSATPSVPISSPASAANASSIRANTPAMPASSNHPVADIPTGSDSLQGQYAPFVVPPPTLPAASPSSSSAKWTEYNHETSNYAHAANKKPTVTSTARVMEGTTVSEKPKHIVTRLSKPSVLSGATLPPSPKILLQREWIIYSKKVGKSAFGNKSLKSLEVVIRDDTLLLMEPVKSSSKAGADRRKLAYLPIDIATVKAVLWNGLCNDVLLHLSFDAEVLILQMPSTDADEVVKVIPGATDQRGRLSDRASFDNLSKRKSTESKHTSIDVIHLQTDGDHAPVTFPVDLKDLPKSTYSTSFGQPLSIPVGLGKLCEYILEYGTMVAGIFRVTGAKKYMEYIEGELKRVRWFSKASNQPLHVAPLVEILKVLETRPKVSHGDDAFLPPKTAREFAPEVANTIKRFLRDVPGGFISNELFEKLKAIQQHEPFTLDIVSSVLINHLDQEKLVVWIYICDFLGQVARSANTTRMSESTLAQLFAPNLGSNARTGGLGTIKGEYQCIEDFIVYCITHVRQLSQTLHDRITPSANNSNSNHNAIETLFSSYTYPQKLVKDGGVSSSYTNLGKCLVEVLNQDRVAYVRMVQQSSHTTVYTTRIAPWFEADPIPTLERTAGLRDQYTNGASSNIYLKLKDCRIAKDFCEIVNAKALESLTASVLELQKNSCLAIESPPNVPHHDLIESCKVEIMVTNERSQKVHLGRGTLHLCSGGQGERYISLNSSRDDSIVLLRARVSDAVDCQFDAATRMLSIAIAMAGHNTVEYTLSITGGIEHAKSFTQSVTRQCMSPASPIPPSFTPSTRTESNRSPPTAIFNNPFAQGLAENAVDFRKPPGSAFSQFTSVAPTFNLTSTIASSQPIRLSEGLSTSSTSVPFAQSTTSSSLYGAAFGRFADAAPAFNLSSASQITLSSSNPVQPLDRSLSPITKDKEETLANTDNEVHLLEENGDEQVALETSASSRSPVVDDQTVIMKDGENVGAAQVRLGTDMTKNTVFDHGKISGSEVEDESTTPPSSEPQTSSLDKCAFCSDPDASEPVPTSVLEALSSRYRRSLVSIRSRFEALRAWRMRLPIRRGRPTFGCDICQRDGDEEACLRCNRYRNEVIEETGVGSYIRSRTSTASSPDSAQSVTVLGPLTGNMTAEESTTTRVSDVVQKNAETRLQTAEYRRQIDKAKAEATSIRKHVEGKKLRVQHLQDRIKFFRSDVAARC
ncbi:hypothetical protein SeLEV6574_g08138 [Synchytrium endobioticum]|uniref:Rho-GAP domain-containing protein n=2 Tax=Synchytrium endobioticum TaxID=286115 RepID=A0A507C2V4_9FUNG|nr:hypothetical protein SeLEV6574_g08138 [Synchytrium endobioticum]